MTARVLIVDDIPANLKLLEARLLADYFDVLCAHSGPEALEILEKHSVDIVLLDVMMPGMDGPSVLSEIRNNEQYQNTPIVFITAKVQADEVDQLLSLGANAVISKPFEPMDMAQKLKDIWEDFHRA